MLVINSIEKTRLSADSYSYSGTGVAWKARLVLFLGFALMAGGLAGSVVSLPVETVSEGSRQGCPRTQDLRALIDHVVGCTGAQIRGTRVHPSNIVFRYCQRGRERTDHAKLCCAMGITKHGR